MLARMTGSTTSGVGWRPRNSATVTMTSAESRAPVFTASTPMSSYTAWSCAVMTHAGSA